MPVLQQIIGSRKKVVTQEEMKLCFCSFCDLMEYSYSHGWRYIPDNYFIDLGFPVDIDLEGREKLKKWGISLECRHSFRASEASRGVGLCSARD